MHKAKITIKLLISILILYSLTTTYDFYRALKTREKMDQQVVFTKQLTCLAQNVYFEAGSEALAGKLAVAQVTVNRVKSRHFPSTICNVVHQHSFKNKKRICQFSWYCAPRKVIKNFDKFMESVVAARMVLVDNYQNPSLKTALFFHSVNVQPNWNYKVVSRIGGHIFYTMR